MSETKQLPTFTVDDTQYQPAVFFGKSACGPMDTEHLAALLAALPDEEQERAFHVLAKLIRAEGPAGTVLEKAERDRWECMWRDAESRAEKLESELSAEREAHAATRLALWNAAPPSPPPAEATGGRRTERGHLYPSPSEPGLDCLHCGCNYFSRESTLTCTGRAPTEETAGKDGRE